MTVTDFFLGIWNNIISFEITTWVGIIIAIAGLFFLINEIKTKVQHGTTSENLMLAFIALTFGLVLLLLRKWILAIALAFFVLAVYQAIQLRESPVWRELMIISVVTYLVLLVGVVADQVIEIITGEGNEIITGWAYNLTVFVFLIMALIFFGKKFVLVSRLMSPQILYLVLFAIIYIVLYLITNVLTISENIQAENLQWFYLSSVLDQSIAERIIFLSIAPYEIIILLAFGMYFVSGPLLTFLLGIKPVEDERVLSLVEEVKTKLGIKRKIRVGFVEAPILNAMAYGPFFNQYIAFMSRSLEEFTDDDIKGIVAHELAHNARIHVVWLQVISSAEMVIKKALLLPATTLDYAAYEQSVPFAVYFLINYGIIAFLYIFVRIMEGDADNITKKAGYGKELAQVLYKLESFYQGIAGDFGLNVQLLTGKEFTEDEKLRFRGEAAIRLYRHLYRPSRWDMLANIFMSHPRTAYRIVAVLDDNFSPVKGALLPYWLLLPNFMRKNALNTLTKKRDQYSSLITDKFNEYYGKEGVKDFLKITRMDELLAIYQDRRVVAYDVVSHKATTGKVTGIHVSDNICQPLFLNVLTETGEQQILITDKEVNDVDSGSYILKNGKMGELKSWDFDEESNRPIFQFSSKDNSSEIFKSRYTGKTLQYFENFITEDVIIYKDGLDRTGKLKKIDFRSSFDDSTFTFEIDNEGKFEESTYQGSELIIDLPPVLIRLDKDKKEKQILLLKSLIDQAVILYTKEEIEIGIACAIKEVKDSSLIYRIRDKDTEIELSKIDYIYLYTNRPKFMIKQHISLFDRIALRLSNRKEMKYIFG